MGLEASCDPHTRSHSCCCDVRQQENATGHGPVSPSSLRALQAGPGGQVPGTLCTDWEKPPLEGNPSPDTLSKSSVVPTLLSHISFSLSFLQTHSPSCPLE